MFICKDNEEQRKRQRAESPAFIITYIILLASIIIQLFVFNMYITSVIGEFIAMAVGGMWATAGYIKQDLCKVKRATLYLFFVYGFIVSFIFSLFAPVNVFFKNNAEFKVCFFVFLKFFCVLFPTCMIIALLLYLVIKCKNVRDEAKKM